MLEPIGKHRTYFIYQVLSDGSSEIITDYIESEEAIKRLKDLMILGEAKSGEVACIFAKDDLNNYVFEWRYGSGIIYPERGWFGFGGE